MFCFRETAESRGLNPLRTKSPKRKCLIIENEKKVEKNFFTRWQMSEPWWGEVGGKEKSG